MLSVPLRVVASCGNRGTSNLTNDDGHACRLARACHWRRREIRVGERMGSNVDSLAIGCRIRREMMSATAGFR